MGCGPSLPAEVVQASDARQFGARTANTGTWDDDFKLPSSSNNAGLTLSKLPSLPIKDNKEEPKTKVEALPLLPTASNNGNNNDISLNNAINPAQPIGKKLPDTSKLTSTFNPHQAFSPKDASLTALTGSSVHEQLAQKSVPSMVPQLGGRSPGPPSPRYHAPNYSHHQQQQQQQQQQRSVNFNPASQRQQQQHQQHSPQRAGVAEPSGRGLVPSTGRENGSGHIRPTYIPTGLTQTQSPNRSGPSYYNNNNNNMSKVPNASRNRNAPSHNPMIHSRPDPFSAGPYLPDRGGVQEVGRARPGGGTAAMAPPPTVPISHHKRPAPPPPAPKPMYSPPHVQGSAMPQQQSHHHRRFDDYYVRGRDLGKGAFAKVFIGVELSTKQEYAVKKIYDRSKMKWNGRDALMDEIGNLQKLRQAPNIVYLHEYFLEEKQCYLVMELLPGKELFERIIQKSTFTEAEARNSCRCVLSALAYMHDQRMAHRDLKPENLLLVDELDIDKVKLSDFGFSRNLNTRNECRTLCGTPGYLAPEILERWPAYDVKCDTWSFGVILFLLLGGYLPFDSHGSNNIKQIFERTRNGQYYFYPQRWQGISQASKDLIAKCLTVNPNKRISSEMALAHEWMGEGLALPKTMISAQSLASTYYETKRYQKDHGDGDRLKELNDDFTVYLGERERDSIVSAMTGTGRGFGGGGLNMSPSPSEFQEDSISGMPFSHFYVKEETPLGQGGFATVFRCRHKASGMSYAVKEVDSSNATKAEKATLRDEITVLKYLRGAPYIIRLYDVFEEDKRTHLILEEMKGGDLLHRIIDKEVYTEREARELCKILFSAVNFCHKKQIAHRDIKLENLLLQEENNDASIKLADFGFAKKVKRENGLKTMLGTPTFMAPEIYDLRKRGYDHRCDLWSVGVVVYCLLGGYLPFEGNMKELSVLVTRGEYKFHDEYWRDISPSAKKLISALLQVDPKNRLSAQQALSSRWMTMDDAELSVVDLSLTKSRMERMITGKEKFKNAVRAIMGANKMQAAAGLRTSMREMSESSSVPAYAIEVVAEYDSELDIEVCFEDVYEIGAPIGVGSLAKIHKATNLLSNKEYSVKKVIRRQLHPGDFTALSDEIAVLQEIAQGGKTHVVCLYEVYEDPDATYLVMERIHGDILIDRLTQKKKYTEFDAKELVRNLLQGVQHCHQKCIAIRNLTLDNLLLPKGSETDIMITDFEIAKKVLYRNSLKTQCGTQEFVAPEVLENRPAYDVSCDIWTVGVIVFILLGGYYPFRGKTDAEILKNVRYGNFEFRDKLWRGVSEDARALLRSMMTVNPDERVTAAAALTHAWIKSDHSVLSADLSENVAEMKKEHVHKFKAAVKTVVATQRLQHLPPAR